VEGLLMQLMEGYERKEIGEKWGVPSIIFLNAIQLGQTQKGLIITLFDILM
jgi:hypothetical protein